MKVGLFLNTQFVEGDSLAARLPELVEQVRLARASGFASLWFPDHYLIGPVQMPQPVPLMAWLLREAEGMTIGPNIRILPLLNPVLGCGGGGDHGPALGRELRARRRPGLPGGGVHRLRHPHRRARPALRRAGRAHPPALDRGEGHPQGPLLHGGGCLASPAAR